MLTARREEGDRIAGLDARLIGRGLANLLSNALRHTPSGGTVRVQAGRDSAGAIIEVFDPGEGIRREDMPYVFESFYRGKKSRSRATGGAGLGLAIAKGIIEAHGGQIDVDSMPGQGTRFYFTLQTPHRSPGDARQLGAT